MGKKINQFLPLSFVSALITALIFLLVILGSIYFANQFKGQAVSIKNSIASRLNIPVKSDRKHEVIGFLPSWAIAKNVSVDPKNLTQIIYFGFGVNENGDIIKFDAQNNPTAEWSNFNSDYFKNLRELSKKSGTKILIAIKNFDNQNIDILISNPAFTDRFINQILGLIKDYRLDGVNIDFEYVTDSNFPTFKHLNQFFNLLNQKLKAENPNYIISADFNATAVQSDPAYDMVKIGDSIDQIILMGYDFSTPNSKNAGPVAPLYSIAGPSIDNSVHAILGRVPFDKVILAIPFYGYEWQTINDQFQSPIVSGTGALATYDRVIQLMKNRKDLEVNWDDKSQTPWITYNQSGAIKQIYFENEQSISKKLSYIKKMKIAGVGVWALGYDGENHAFWDLITKFKE